MNTGDVEDRGFLGGVQSPSFQFAGINYWGGDNFPTDAPMGVDHYPTGGVVVTNWANSSPPPRVIRSFSEDSSLPAD